MNAGDVVVDVGSYLGVTSLTAAETASKVYAIEPSPRAVHCLKANTTDVDNIEVVQLAISDTITSTELQLRNRVADDSLIIPDDGGSGDSVTVETTIVEELASRLGLDTIDFLKVEVEGLEPEVVSSVDDFPAEKIVSMGNAERYGETTYEDVAGILRERGYAVDVDKEHPYDIVYAST